MRRKKPPPNPHCPVPRCQTKAPHNDDPIVKALSMLTTSSAGLAKLSEWARDVMGEMRDSMCRDLDEKRLSGWFFRLRQVEELYHRTLYLIFIATPDEVPHIMSGDPRRSQSSAEWNDRE
jgi:hypothetical protein